MSVLEARALTVGYPVGERVAVAVSEVSVALEPGRIVGLAGESGAGKSTLALALAGYLPPGATVLVGGECSDSATRTCSPRRRSAFAGSGGPRSLTCRRTARPR